MIPRVSSHRALLAAVAILLFWQVVALWPSSTPVEDSPGNPPNAPQALKTEPAREAPTFRGFSPPVAAAPDYSIQRFRYVSVSTGQKQWQLLARSADFYSDHDTVLAQEIQAELFSNDLKQTLSVKVTGREARYLVSTRELEVGGNVRASFPDGSEIQSDYLRFDPKLRRVLIPTRYFTQGKGPNSKTTQISFTSQGLEGSLDEGHFVLPANVMIEVSKQALARHTSEHPSHHSAPAIFRASKAELWNPQRLLRLDSRSTPLKDSFVTLEQSGPNELRA
jgi:LPS export ABC transporter protein LptC